MTRKLHWQTACRGRIDSFVEKGFTPAASATARRSAGGSTGTLNRCHAPEYYNQYSPVGCTSVTFEAV